MLYKALNVSVVAQATPWGRLMHSTSLCVEAVIPSKYSRQPRNQKSQEWYPKWNRFLMNGLPPRTLDTVGWTSPLHASLGLRLWSKAKLGTQAVDSSTGCNSPGYAGLNMTCVCSPGRGVLSWRETRRPDGLVHLVSAQAWCPGRMRLYRSARFRVLRRFLL